MLGFNYENFKNALRREEERRYQELKRDLSNVTLFIEKTIDKFFNSTSHLSRLAYPGIDL